MKDLGATNLNFAEEQWRSYRKDPASVSQEWRDYFAAMEEKDHYYEGATPTLVLGHEQLFAGEGPGGSRCAGCGRVNALSVLQHKVGELIRNYRVRGHLAADLDPLGHKRATPPELDYRYYGFVKEDLDLEFSAGPLAPEGSITLKEILRRLQDTYCSKVGVQYMHIDKPEKRKWLQDRMESSQNHIQLSIDRQKRILTSLTDAVIFEQFLQRKFVGAKSFSLEGAESLIPLLDMAIEKAGDNGVRDVVLGMPHRGRLNVLCNIMGKHPMQVFNEFKDEDATALIGRGDVKYHLGYESVWKTRKGHEVALDLVFNPSHLEFVSPVAQGRLRAKLDNHGTGTKKEALLVLMHGDASFIGEGIVQETLNLSQLEGYKIGGTLHVVVNNQIGFTTTEEDGRSSTYASDVARMLPIPVFHVNGENPEAVAQAVNLALDFQNQFSSDVVIDMYCYRRRGHNEGDEPKFTQPLMYKRIAGLPTVRESYLSHLVRLGGVSSEEAEQIKTHRNEFLEQELEHTGDQQPPAEPSGRPSFWTGFTPPNALAFAQVDTTLKTERQEWLMERLTSVPNNFEPHRKISKLLATRRQMGQGKRPLDWGAAEALALASLTDEGCRIRLSGQDSQRGTFSHRHAVLHSIENGDSYMPMGNLNSGQAPVEIINSPLSEGSVLGFEYGYSTAAPDSLVIWEAQFGDFANAAQVYIDQFIASGEQKWDVKSGLVLLLPHGLEGTGPEHASARLERYLSLAANDNYQVVLPSTPAQIFHLLRRQSMAPWQKPLVILSPKSMLRHPAAVSSREELSTGGFSTVIDDSLVSVEDATRILLCCGKVYYDLLKRRDSIEDSKVSILRIEQLYPFDRDKIQAILLRKNAQASLHWVQEEPINMGAWPYLKLEHEDWFLEFGPLNIHARKASASPATGSAASHRLEQGHLVNSAFRKIVTKRTKGDSIVI
jgi:2-oxoglutarate dehydrogenase E1 component